jgi:hypothetical protein
VPLSRLRPAALRRTPCPALAEGGETSLDNTMLLCRFHHRLVHEEGYQLERPARDEIQFQGPRGRPIPEAPAPPRSPIDPFEALLQRLEDGAMVIDPYTGTPLWDGSPPDLGLAVEWLLAKRETPGGATTPR